MEVHETEKFYVQARLGYFAVKKEPSGPSAEERTDAEVNGNDERETVFSGW